MPRVPLGWALQSMLLLEKVMVLILDGSPEHGVQYGAKQIFRFVEGSWLKRKSRQI